MTRKSQYNTSSLPWQQCVLGRDVAVFARVLVHVVSREQTSFVSSLKWLFQASHNRAQSHKITDSAKSSATVCRHLSLVVTSSPPQLWEIRYTIATAIRRVRGDPIGE